MTLLLSLVLACTKPVPATDGSPPADADTDTDTDADTDADTDTDEATGDTSVPGPTGDTAPSFDCSAPWPTATFTPMTGWGDAEDFDFDGDGYHASVQNKNLIAKDQYGGSKVITPNISNWTAGTRVLITGDWVVADPGNSSIVLVTAATGGQQEILSGLAYPNGIDVDADSNVYIGENYGNRVIRVNAYDPTDIEVIAMGVSEPNGVILSPDEQTLYVGSFGGGKIYAVDRDPAGGWQPHRVFYDPVGPDGGFDGINVDICGNVYITEYIRGNVYRVAPDASRAELMVHLPSSWIPNLRWGVGVGGWDPDLLYVADRDQGRLFAVDPGIPGKPHILAP